MIAAGGHSVRLAQDIADIVGCPTAVTQHPSGTDQTMLGVRPCHNHQTLYCSVSSSCCHSRATLNASTRHQRLQGVPVLIWQHHQSNEWCENTKCLHYRLDRSDMWTGHCIETVIAMYNNTGCFSCHNNSYKECLGCGQSLHPINLQ